MQVIDMDSIDEEVSRLIHRLSVPQGGFIGTHYAKPLGFAPEKNEMMLEAFKAFRWNS